jgi:hypothetical protein
MMHEQVVDPHIKLVERRQDQPIPFIIFHLPQTQKDKLHQEVNMTHREQQFNDLKDIVLLIYQVTILLTLDLRTKILTHIRHVLAQQLLINDHLRLHLKELLRSKSKDGTRLLVLIMSKEQAQVIQKVRAKA